MRIGVLDIGSTSARLQVLDVFPGAPPVPVRAVKEPTQLSTAFQADGSIDEAAADRVVRAAAAGVWSAHRLGVTELCVFVTAAVRDATNREDILDRIEEKTGFRPAFLSGEQEAQLTYLAAHHWLRWSSGRLLLLDIGGGSMEIAHGVGDEPDWAISLPLGARTLTAEFLPGDPPEPGDVQALQSQVRSILAAAGPRLGGAGTPDLAVATSKTFDQLARLAGAPPKRRNPQAERWLTTADLAAWIPRLAGLPAAVRAALPGVSRARSGQILAGAVVAREAMRSWGIRGVRLCPWALREGIVLHRLRLRPAEKPLLPCHSLTPCGTDLSA
ncbi:MAG TPA: hypothetical protein VG756_06460 [Pseudonocardiaceae bacterium]|nr:hypothetical protein [Pseudonocardiaceae bacterium]